MSTAGHTPNFIAEEDILPFRCVKIGSANFKAVPSTSDPEILLGVTDGSIQTFNSVYHATAGQPISLQNGEFVQLTAGGTIAVGDTLIATTDGKVIADTASTEYIAQAAEGANDGEIFWAKKIGAWTIGGGGGGGTMTVDVQEFDPVDEVYSFIWTKPAGAKMVYIAACGGGCDGYPGEEVAYGGYGYGGGAGQYAFKSFDAESLPNTLIVSLGIHRNPLAIPYPSNSTSILAFNGTENVTILNAACGGKETIYNYPVGPFSGASPYAGNAVGAQYSFGWGAGEEANQRMDGNVGWGPGGGGAGGNEGFGFIDGGAGGRAGAASSGTSLYFGSYPPSVDVGGGGAGGAGDSGIEPGASGGNGTIDPITGFGGGGGGGGYSGSDAAGNGGNGIRGGGGGGGGMTALGTPGIGGQGGDGYVRITTICFN